MAPASSNEGPVQHWDFQDYFPLWGVEYKLQELWFQTKLPHIDPIEEVKTQDRITHAEVPHWEILV